MKSLLFLVAFFAAAIASSGETTNVFERFSPHFSTNCAIIWQAPTDHVPKGIWIYKRPLPQPFRSTVISNAVVLASLQDKGFPKPSTNEFCLDLDSSPCGHPCTFSISPKTTTISFWSPTHANGSSIDIPSEEIVIKRAWECAALFGLGRPYLSQNSVYTNLCDYDELGRLATNNICERGVFLSRVLDGISFLSVANNESVDEGFGIAFGSYGKIRSFVFIWPNLERDKLSQTASSQEIIACIKARKTIVSPKDDEPNYFARLTNLAKTKVFTITKITPFYVEGVLGEKPADDGPSKIIAPIAELEGVADFGNSNLTVRLFSPILSSDVNRLLGK